MTISIPSPRNSASDVDMQIDCQIAIDAPVRDLFDAIIQAGWAPKVAYAALKNVAEHQAIAYQQDPDPADDPAHGEI
ncbi:hypothetical protein GB928_025600 [Shinella curvata]|uniref:Uncharacterized protein n=1 Tax=Shinella curvata TaxID=1817964 RepID=A0ABT8XLI1_9HYPH|nr:hypothetical protein [Shinella curvata]MCJ8056964.1 hypothetical protein [Shinella curvata]MDO6124568.1 hypothetical protein [Shinella curvata]